MVDLQRKSLMRSQKSKIRKSRRIDLEAETIFWLRVFSIIEIWVGSYRKKLLAVLNASQSFRKPPFYYFSTILVWGAGSTYLERMRYPHGISPCCYFLTHTTFLDRSQWILLMFPRKVWPTLSQEKVIGVWNYGKIRRVLPTKTSSIFLHW